MHNMLLSGLSISIDPAFNKPRQMATILQKTFSIFFSYEIYCLLLKFHKILFPWVQLTNIQHQFRYNGKNRFV